MLVHQSLIKPFFTAQVLVEQCRRLGVDVEASSAHLAHMQQAAGRDNGGAKGAGGGGRKPGWNLDISAIHERIKQVPAPAIVVMPN